MESNRIHRFLVLLAAAAMLPVLLHGSELVPQSQSPPNQDADEVIFALAAGYYSDEKWDSAIEQFQLLIGRYPESELAAHATFYLGESLVQAGNHRRAEQVFQDYVRLQTGDEFVARVQFRMAECKYLNAEFEAARELFAAFVSRHRDNVLAEYAWPYLGELHLRFQDPQAAKTAYENALQRFPSSHLSNKCRLGLAQSLDRLNQPDEAARFYHLIAGQLADPLADDALLLAGKMYATRGETERATREFEDLLDKFPASELAREARYLAAKADLVAGQYEIWWRNMEPLLHDSLPDKLAIQIALDAAVVATRLEKLDRAQQLIATIQNASSAEWAQEFARVVEIDIAQRKGEFQRLHALVEAFAKSFPQSAHLTRCIEPLARMHYDREEYAEAASRYQQLLDLVAQQKLAAGNPSAWRYFLGLCQIGTAQYPQAIETLQVIEDFAGDRPFQAATCFALATALSANQQYAEALPRYQEYLKLAPQGQDWVRCHADLAVAQLKCGQLQTAATTLQSVTEAHAAEAAVLAACEAVAEAAMGAEDTTTAVSFFTILANSDHPKYAARGTSGLLWSDDNMTLDSAQVEQLLSSGMEIDLALEALLGKIQKLQSANRHAETVSVLQKIIQQHPQSHLVGEAKFRLAISLQRIGGSENSRQASQLFEDFLRQQSEHKLSDLARYELAWSQHDCGQQEVAELMFAEIAENYPDSPYRIDACYRSAMLARDLGNKTRAELRLRQLIDWAPQHALTAYAHYTLAEFAKDDEQWKKAIPLFQRVTETAADEGLLNPARYWLAESHYQAGQIEQAERQFQAIQGIEFDQPDMPSIIHLRLAQCAARRADWNAVESMVQAARQPDSPDAAIDPDSGINSELAASTDSADSASYQLDYLQGRVYMSRAKFQEAREMFDKVLNHPQAAGTRTAAMSQWMIGESWFHQEQFQDALHAYLLVDSLYDFPDWRSLALLQAAKCHFQLGDPETASKTCQRMLQTFPDSSHAADARVLLAELDAAQVPEKQKPKTLPANYSK